MAAGQRAAASTAAYLTGATLETAPAPSGLVSLVLNEDALAVTGTGRRRRGCPCRSAPSEARTPLASVRTRLGRSRSAAPTAGAWRSTPRTSRRLWWRWTHKSRPRSGRWRSVTSLPWPRANRRSWAREELIEEIVIPARDTRTRQRDLKFRIRNAIDFPIVGLAFRAAVVDGKFRDARVVLGAVAPVPLRAPAVEALLEGRAPSEALADEAAALAVRDEEPLARNRAKVEIVKALVRRAVLTG